MSTYKVRAERDGKSWYVSIPELDGATQARNLREVETMARDWIHCMTDEDPGSIHLDVTIEIPRSAKHHLERNESLRSAADRARSEALSEAKLAARALRDEGLPLRDIGKLLGVSPQRVHELVSKN